MKTKPVRVLFVDADPSEGQVLRARLDTVEGIELVGVALSRRAALQQLRTTLPDVMLVDLMLPGHNSIDLIAR